MVLCGTSAIADGPADDPDWVAPYLGLDLFAAEELQNDLQLVPDEVQAAHTLLPGSAPLWARLLPDLTLALQYRIAKQRLVAAAGWQRQSDGLILLVWADFPLPEELSPRASMVDARAAAQSWRPVASAWQEPAESAPLAVVAGASVEATGPSVQELQGAAERACATPLSDLSGWASRARTSALLPELSLDYRRNVGEIDTLGIRSDLGIDSHNIEDITRYGVRATWQLGQIVFNREELNAAQTAEGIERARRELLIEVSRLYFQRQALTAELRLRPGPEPARRAQLSRELGQTEAQLDALTGGYLSRQLGRAAP
jgi:hypothetical protein